MLAVSPLRSCNNEREADQMESFSNCENLLDDIDFDDLFVGMDDGDVLPDLEMDQEILSEFFGSNGEEWKIEENGKILEEEDRGSGSGSNSNSNSSGGDEIVSKRDDEAVKVKEVDRSRKSATQTKGSHGKRKMKVDWTPELHRRFVQAVEQLGMDKAVPSRILELMGTDCLTRHNIASHLQKYRSHQKHLRAREAEAASWNQRRQMYGVVVGGGRKKDMNVNPWVAPTMGFPPPTSLQPFRPPLHVWGHPSTVDQSLMHMWPKHLAHSLPPPPPPWTPPPADPSYWHPHHQRVPTISPGTPCFAQTLATTRFPIPPVRGFPPHAMYKVDQGIGVPIGQSHSQPPIFDDFHPSKESIDAAIEDVLSKPWLALPIGLKPPSLEGVIVELQRQGIPKVPSICDLSLEQANGTDTARHPKS